MVYMRLKRGSSSGYRSLDQSLRVRSRLNKLVIAVVCVAILFAPAVAFVAGARGAPIENRASVPFRGIDPGWQAFGEFGLYMADRLPLRTTAIRADAVIDEYLYREDPAFGGSSSARVIRGLDGFLFLADAIDNACSPHLTPSQTANNLEALARVIDRSGRDVLTMIAPDKSSVLPELLPSDLAKRGCFDDYTAALWADMEAAGIPGYLDLRAELVATSSSTREPLYLRKDSHWDSAGAIVGVKAAIERLKPGLWDDSEVKYNGLGEYTGDLTGLLGNPQVDQAPLYSVSRQDVVPVSTEVIDDIEGGFNRRFVNSAPSGRLVPGKTLLFLDSFGLVALPNIVPFFEDLTVVRFVDFEPSRFAALINEAESVWMLCVERSLGYRMMAEIGSPEFVTSLNASLDSLGASP